ncbi:ribbon-helix-helix domain-containing protein [Sphingomonas sp. M1-B02]|uniref:ribbon-helix-helix domain-containing protein n=1 Tax=Sphingomonas sp. M1-B02 TaxID=3114300 RepID=UPI00224022F1|nr:type II toxin-antitoxin system ParD family antitoxin [Sphingomonas sp. S6-11]UZK65549.1 type II toxin-antitoxin system ParD family antitoxin [Sphingomonas sp. S6-11]
MKIWADARVADGGYDSMSDYVRDLMQRDLDDSEAGQRLQAATDLGRASGVGDRTIEDIIAASRSG